MKLTDLRGILQYIPRFREKVFVISVDGAIVTSENFANILLDVAVLRSLNIKVLLVHGAGAQIETLAREQNIQPSDLDGSGITDAPTLKLALIGDAPYAHDYIRRIRDTADRRVAIPGAIYGEGYRELGSHCFAYIHATEVGGTHPALIEAMGRGALVLYRDTSENAEVAGDAGIPFEPAELADKIRAVLEMSEEQREVFRRRATERVRQRYSWDAVTDAYESLLRKLAG